MNPTERTPEEQLNIEATANSLMILHDALSIYFARVGKVVSKDELDFFVFELFAKVLKEQGTEDDRPFTGEQLLKNIKCDWEI